jgi:Maltose operon periplasmic protein precursor (MalM)
MKMPRGIAFISMATASAIAIGGCATRGQNLIDSSQTKLTSARLANGFSDIAPIDLKMNAAQEFQFGAESAGVVTDAAITLDGNERVFAKVFRLPRWEAQYSLNITSMVMGGLADPAIFYPRYIMLDAQFKPTRRGAMRDFVYRGIGAQGAISATVFVNESNRDEAYIAIAGETRGAIKEQTSVMQSAGMQAVAVPVKGGGLFMWMIPTGGTELPKAMRSAAGGNLEVRLTSYVPKRYD